MAFTLAGIIGASLTPCPVLLRSLRLPPSWPFGLNDHPVHKLIHRSMDQPLIVERPFKNDALLLFGELSGQVDPEFLKQLGYPLISPPLVADRIFHDDLSQL